MMRNHASKVLAAAAIGLVATLGLVGAQTGEPMPEMTPEQAAMMEAYMKAGAPGPAHEALAATAGSYTLEITSWHEPGGPPMKEGGTAERSMILGGRVLVEEIDSTMMGMPFNGQGMTGFDNVTGKYWSTWMDSMSTGMMVSEGTCDAAGKNCTYHGSWNDPITKGPVQARIVTVWKSPTVQHFEMYGPGPDGKEMKKMENLYTKK